MPVSPQLGSDGVVRVTVLCDGSPLADSARLVSVTVNRGASLIPSARLVIEDGDMATGAWSVTDAATFEPGATVAIRAGYGDHEDVLFEGVVVTLGVKVGGPGDNRVVVDCRDEAVRMTVGYGYANYVDQTDSQIIERLAAAHGLPIRVDATSTAHAAVAQHACTDWDFLVSRAERNGLLVVATDGALAVEAPRGEGPAALKVTLGVDLMEFQAEIDARTQLARVEAVAWDPGAQAVVRGATAGPARLNAQGDLGPARLAEVFGPEPLSLRSPTPSGAALADLARAQQVRAGLARIRGRMRFQGSAKARVGELIELEGVGARFSGAVLVGALEHEISDGNWTTQVTFGPPPDRIAGHRDELAPLGVGGLPGVEGLQIGVVTQRDDPEGAQRIRVRMPLFDPETEVWARLSQIQASKGFGSFVLPDVGDEVILGFFGNDPACPVILGSLYSSARPPPYAVDDSVTALVTRGLARIEIADDGRVITITTPGDNQVVLNDKDGSVRLQDKRGNAVVLGLGGITLDSPGDINFTARGSVRLQAVGAITIAATSDVTLEGLNVTCDAKVGFAGRGAAAAELSATGQTTVKGAMVMIN